MPVYPGAFPRPGRRTTTRQPSTGTPTQGGIEPPTLRFSVGNSQSREWRLQACTTPLTCEDRPWKGPNGAVWVCTVGPFWTVGGTRGDQDPGQRPGPFEPSNALPSRRCRQPITTPVPS